MFHFSRISRILISASLGVLAGNLLFLLLPYVPSAGRIISSATASFGGDTKFLILYSLLWSILGGIAGAFVWKKTKDAGAVSPNRPKTGFTLIELLVVVAIVAIVAIVLVYTINPAELFRRARDSTRLSDLDTITKAISIYQTDVSSGSLGVASTTYISIPDPAATTTAGTNCASLGLPSPPSGWSWHCAASSTYRNTDGTGWIPLNFKQISFGSPLGSLPVDPVNTTSTGEYYTYTTGGSYKLTSRFESEKYTPQAGTDGGPDPALYEVGSNKDLAPFVGGLVGWWKFDETGTTANDSSGYGNNGTMYSSTTISDLHTTSNCQVGSGCGSFDGTDDYVGVLTTLLKNEQTVSFWMRPDGNVSGGLSYK
jgi:prepilin-type N-terminal cleavage/methylation domain-containing protein